MKSVCLLTVIVLIGLISCGRRDCAPTEYFVSKAAWADSPVVIDGVLNETVWQKAPVIVLKDNMTSEVVSDTSRLTFVRACYNTVDLYISFVCRDSDIWGNMTERDQHLWEEEAVEVFLDVDDEVNTYLEVEVSPQNILFDSFIVDPFDIDVEATAQYDLAGIRTAVRVEGTLNDRGDVDRKWVVEIALPLHELSTEFDIGQVQQIAWKVNYYRIDRKSEESYHYSSSPTGGRFHMPSVFGKLVFAPSQ